ncbi:hypothetical protein [Mycobacterium sp. SMC-19]|uniref:hypothetical protein n=1 Tax=Mycobacterium sp. SMC-19 TaxID=3381630 RepID=UPI003875C768
MKRLNRILRAPGRALAKAPRWVRVVRVLALATACAFGVEWAQDLARERGYASGVAEASRRAAASYSAGYAAGERHEERRNRGVVEVADLPAGVDRDAAAKAEERGEAFAFHSARPEVGCTVTLRLPAGTVIGIPDNTGAVGVGLDTTYWSCDVPSNERLPGSGPPPTVADMPRRWDQSIRNGDAFAYGTGDGVRVDISRCTGFTVPLPVPAGGVAVPATVPILAGDACSREPVAEMPKPR